MDEKIYNYKFKGNLLKPNHSNNKKQSNYLKKDIILFKNSANNSNNSINKRGNGDKIMNKFIGDKYKTVNNFPYKRIKSDEIQFKKLFLKTNYNYNINTPKNKEKFNQKKNNIKFVVTESNKQTTFTSNLKHKINNNSKNKIKEKKTGD